MGSSESCSWILGLTVGTGCSGICVSASKKEAGPLELSTMAGYSTSLAGYPLDDGVRLAE